MTMLKALDPAGVSQPARRRLKHRIYRNKVTVPIMHKRVDSLIIFFLLRALMWHCDGYDKLTPYGLTIHGCIYIYIWVRNNNNY